MTPGPGISRAEPIARGQAVYGHSFPPAMNESIHGGGKRHNRGSLIIHLL